MRHKDYYAAIAAALVAGLLGGAVSSHLWTPEPVIAQEKPRRMMVIETGGIRLVDQSGKIRATFEIGADGSVGLAMVGREGGLRARLGVEANGNTVLDLNDEKGKPHAVLSVASKGGPSLLLYDRTGRGGVLLGEGTIPLSDVGIVEERPAGSLVLLNKDGKVAWRAP